MKIFLAFIFLCISFDIFACQTLADEVPIPKQASHPSGKLPEMHKKQVGEDPGKSFSLTEGIKIGQQRSLDPAAFTMIRPFTVDRSPVKLPVEQILD